MNFDEVAKRLQQLPASTQLAVVHCLPNIAYGAHWGLCKVEEVKDNLAEIKEDKNLFVLPVSQGVVLQVNEGYLEYICNEVCRGIVDAEDYKKMLAMKEKALNDFDKYIASSLKPAKGVHKTYVGIYCINKLTNIRYDNVDYPAFRVNLSDALNIIGAYGVAVGIGDFKVSAQDVINALNGNDIARKKAISKSLILSPTGTGVFLPIYL